MSLVVIGYWTFFTTAGTRAKDVFFYNKTEATNAVNESIYRQTVVGFPNKLRRIFANKPLVVIYDFFDNYGQHFEYNYLFAGSEQSPAFVFPRHGNLLLIYLPFLAFGLIGLRNGQRSKEYWFFMGWLLLAPIPSAISDGAPNANRSLVMTIPLSFFVARGMILVYEWLQQRFASWQLHSLGMVLIGVALISNLSLYWHDYWLYFPERSEQYWHGFMKQAMIDTYQQRNNYQTIYFSNTDTQPYIFYAWYNLVDPTLVQANAANRDLNTMEGIKQLYNIKFTAVKDYNLACYLQEENVLVVVSANDNMPWEADKFVPKITYQHDDRFFEGQPALWVYDSKEISNDWRQIIATECQESGWQQPTDDAKPE